MSEWKEYKLGDAYDFSSGLSKSADQFGYGNEFLTFKDVFNNYFLPEKLTSLVNSTIKERETCSINRGDVFLTRTSETDDELGMSSVALKDYPNATFNGFTKRLRPNGKIKIYPEFIAYYLRSHRFRSYIVGMSSITTRASLNNSMLSSLPLNIPSYEKQFEIGNQLKSLDDKIDLLNRENKTLEAMAETLFRKWFVEDAKEDWKEKPLSYFGEIICGKTPSKKKHDFYNGNIPFIKIPDMHKDAFVFQSEDSLSELGRNSQKNKTLPSKSILVSCIATVGLVAMNAFVSQTNQQINSIVPYKSYYRYFLYLIMKSMYFDLQAMASGGTATLNLNTGDFSKISICCPNDDYFISFNTSVEQYFNKIYMNQKQIITLNQLRNVLLPKLMNSEVRVKE